MVEPEANATSASPGGVKTQRAGLLRRAIRATVGFTGAILVLATLAGLLGRAAWWLDLTNHFRFHLMLALVLVAVAQAIARPRVLAAAWAAGALVNGLLLSPLWLPATPPGAGPRITIVHANVGGDPVDAAALAAWVNDLSPEWVSLQEITPRNLLRIAAKLPDYEVAADAPRPDTRGVALFHRVEPATTRPTFAARVVYVTPDKNRPMVSFDFDLGGRGVSVLGFHTTRPAPANNWRWQREGLDAAAAWSVAQRAAGGGEVLLVGDFNATSQGVLSRELCRKAKLLDARRGYGTAGTWPSAVPAPLRIGIDAAYASAGLAVTEFAVGPDVGSDHRPIAVTVALAKPLP